MQDIDDLLRLKRTVAPNLDGVIIGKALYTGAIDLAEVLQRAQH
jgi:phosphoribosylformimino-5-aminoimidazole carboxamide ribonucleotide (ProFAR) isomerase